MNDVLMNNLFLFFNQGIVQGPEEFAEGVALGMRSLFGHAVGMYNVFQLIKEIIFYRMNESAFDLQIGNTEFFFSTVHNILIKMIGMYLTY